VRSTKLAQSQSSNALKINALSFTRATIHHMQTH